MTKKNRTWTIPIVIQNRSISSAEKFHISLIFKSNRSYTDLNVSGFIDMSQLNPGKVIYMLDKSSNSIIIFRSVNQVLGEINFKMRPRYRKFKLEVTLLAHLMRGREVFIEVDLIPEKPKVIKIKEELMD